MMEIQGTTNGVSVERRSPGNPFDAGRTESRTLSASARESDHDSVVLTHGVMAISAAEGIEVAAPQSDESLRAESSQLTERVALGLSKLFMETIFGPDTEEDEESPEEIGRGEIQDHEIETRLKALQPLVAELSSAHATPNHSVINALMTGY